MIEKIRKYNDLLNLESNEDLLNCYFGKDVVKEFHFRRIESENFILDFDTFEFIIKSCDAYFVNDIQEKGSVKGWLNEIELEMLDFLKI